MSDTDTITLTLTREEAETALDILADGETGWPESSYWYGLVRSAVAKLRAALEGSEDEPSHRDGERRCQPSSRRLADALREARFFPLAARAERDEFHDFKSPHVLPEIELVKELRKLGKRGAEFSQRVIAGEFDATIEESDKWAASPEGQAVLRSLGAG